MTGTSSGGQLVVRGGSINGVSYDAIAGSATCQMFAAGAGIAAGIAVNSALTGQIWGVVGGGAGLLAANALAAANGCFPVNPDDGPGSGGDGIAGGQCTETTGCNLVLMRKGGGSQYVGPVKRLVSSVRSGTYPNGSPKCTTTWIDCDGATVQDDEAISDLWPITTTILNGDTCAGEPSPEPSPGLPDPVPVPDPDGGPCTFNTQLIDSYINAAGGMSILYETCATGEGCSGCARFWYHGPGNTQPAPPEPIPGPDGEPLPQPDPEGGGGPCPDPCEPCRFEPCEPPAAEITQRDFSFTSACGENEDGSKKTVTYSLQGASELKECFQALAGQNATIMQMLQQHLNWKTPICPPERPELKGDFVTVRFESDSKSPNGKLPLRKLLRYRSQSSRDLGQLTDYWQSFTWRTGPVCVYHKGSAVGTPQVWASSADEGKRVLRHAFGEAGVDPDQIGEWGVSGSDNPRYGVSLTVRVKSIDGGHWVTSREGPDGLPLLAFDP